MQDGASANAKKTAVPISKHSDDVIEKALIEYLIELRRRAHLGADMGFFMIKRFGADYEYRVSLPDFTWKQHNHRPSAAEDVRACRADLERSSSPGSTSSAEMTITSALWRSHLMGRE